MTPYKLLSLLLQHPTTDVLEAREELVMEAAHLRHRPSRDAASALLDAWRGATLTELQRSYADTFDFDRRASLHLTFHTHGDRRQRGIELIRLKRRFANAGLSLAEGELPDYLPVLLEFAALAPEAGEALLVELREPLELVRTRLHERESPYACLLDAVVEGLPRLTAAQAERIRRLAEQGPPTELVGLEPFVHPELAGAARGRS